jgi:hypothetical protein
MEKIIFSKIKSTDQFLFNKAIAVSLVIDSDIVELSTFPYIKFTGKYYINQIVKENFICTVYHVSKESSYDESDNWNLYISKSKNKVMLYNQKNEGVILKR